MNRNLKIACTEYIRFRSYLAENEQGSCIASRFHSRQGNGADSLYRNCTAFIGTDTYRV